MANGYRVEISPDDLRRLLGKSSQFEAKQKTALRKRIREAAGPTAAAVRVAALREPVERGNPPDEHTGLRAGIASSVRVQILAGKRAGVAIRTSGRMARAWESGKGWRHPVFGDRDAAWQPQKGRPRFFAGTIWGQRNRTRRAVEQAMRDALDTMGD